jgi:hypothetical protein
LIALSKGIPKINVQMEFLAIGKRTKVKFNKFKDPKTLPKMLKGSVLKATAKIIQHSFSFTVKSGNN